jgi:hypothetical protein
MELRSQHGAALVDEERPSPMDGAESFDLRLDGGSAGGWCCGMAATLSPSPSPFHFEAPAKHLEPETEDAPLL